MLNQKLSRGLIFIAISACVAIPATLAHEGATGVVDKRMDSMKDIASQMKMLSGMIREPASFDGTAAAGAGQVIAEHAAEIEVYFPEGSDGNPSEASPKIWVEWDAFAGFATQMQNLALALSAVSAKASQAGELEESFKALGQTCQSCHSQFRIAN